MACAVGTGNECSLTGSSYHIKYMHIGDAHGKKEELEQLVTSLHLPLRARLRFLTPSLAERAE